MSLNSQSRLGFEALDASGFGYREGAAGEAPPDLKLCVDSELNNPSRMEPYVTCHCWPMDPCTRAGMTCLWVCDECSIVQWCESMKKSQTWHFIRNLTRSSYWKQWLVQMNFAQCHCESARRLHWQQLGLIGLQLHVTGLIYPHLVWTY